MQRIYILFSITLFSLISYAQEKKEVTPPYYLRSIIFTGATDEQFPVITLSETATLQFDDIDAQEADYYYKIVHCNYDWTPSNLNKSQYLNGVDDQRIIDYSNSFTTLQPYSHYTLTIPNNRTKLTITGNYMLEIYNDYDELMFSRRFVVYKPAHAVEVNIKRSRDLNYTYTKQVVQLGIKNTTNIINPQEQLKTVILQNYNWNTAIYNIKPQYTLGDELIYKYDQETAFWAGNEYYFFDNNNIRISGNGVLKIELKDIYHSYLYPAERRSEKPYTYYPDINGDFEVNTLNGRNNETEAEYAFVHFFLENEPSLADKDIYVYGKFNNYEFTDENKLTMNKETGVLESTMLLKQGFYNYKFVTIDNSETIDYNNIGGNFYQTENDYMVLVYYRGYGDLYDSLIGVGYGSSQNITN
ncbi:type IX secretion system plug protein [Neptunitalea lumnitzerae]|uniref:DUF5103 domain-containing protein n=1 Tax=Neptunitalea lumnitzerae TaxID=2965509 RepID=A0ABQ5MMC7_9FLAO|nr:type IX secretion system plug protein domain-containing protein [Neptunitalea sp. Y10]GLB50537.1 DUF5103 domain-containing protein [Neptunitalea sp. Y10]